MNSTLLSRDQLLIQFEEYLTKKAFENYPDSLLEPSKYIIQLKAKRIRPLMLLTACQTFNGNLEEAMGPASAIEIFHNFSLVHDDIIDNADKRRGEYSVHKKFGLNKAILAGDAMLLHSYIQLTKGSGQHQMEMLKVYNKATAQVIEGEQLDMDFEDTPQISESEYMTMIKYKTSVLLAASVQIGAIIGNAGIKDQNEIYNFGLNLGLAFQIKDDYLDSFGDHKTFGKKIGGDIIQNKKTFLLVTALQNANSSQKEKIFELFAEANEDKKISEMHNIFNELGVKELAKNKMEQLYLNSISSLRNLTVGEEDKKSLHELAEMIYKRKH